MKSRVFWNCLMNEMILVQELHLPPSGLDRLEESVPIPKFIGFETATFARTGFPSSADDVDDSLFQYHFLAQVAHRIILTRIRDSLYFYCKHHPAIQPSMYPFTTHSDSRPADSGAFPLPAVNAELHHQLEQWRLNLPAALQFADLDTSPTASPSTAATSPISPLPVDPPRPLSPATAVAEAMLRGRYMIAKFHIGRPYLYKALRTPAALTDDDLEQVRCGLRNAMDWPIVQGMFTKMKSCVPIKFAFCSQYVSLISSF